MAEIKEVRIAVQDLINNTVSDGGSCAENEPFALQVTDDSMEPEFDQGCIIIIDPSGVLRDGAFVFAKDNRGEYTFRRLREYGGKHYLEPLNPAYDTVEIQPRQVEGVITQRSGKRRSYHKWYDK